MKKKVFEFIVVDIIILAAIIFFYILDFRFCPFYNLFKIPCPGCGLTRALICLLEGKVELSIEYNLTLIPLMIISIIYFLWKMYDVINLKNTLENFMKKYKSIIIIFVVLLLIVSEIKNIHNPMLY